jgi:SAM-dependent methyltransferase
MTFKDRISILMNPRSKYSFLWNCSKRYHNQQQVLLDVGCGNNSVFHVKHYYPDCYYIGLDIGDYNLEPENKLLMDEYIVTTPEKFASEIENLEKVDVIISAHNIEHCNEPDRVMKTMFNKLKTGGCIYMSFPNSESVNFPHRQGTLNFYDDDTHQYVPDFDRILSLMEENGIKIEFCSKAYKPFLMYLRGALKEPLSRKNKKVMWGTWAYWGFETVIWGRKQ